MGETGSIPVRMAGTSPNIRQITTKHVNNMRKFYDPGTPGTEAAGGDAKAPDENVKDGGANGNLDEGNTEDQKEEPKEGKEEA